MLAGTGGETLGLTVPPPAVDDVTAVANGQLGPAGGRLGDFKLGDLILGDFSLGSRALMDELPYLVGETILNLARSGLPCLRTEFVVVSRGEIWLGRSTSRSELVRRSPGEVDKTSCANLKHKQNVRC